MRARDAVATLDGDGSDPLRAERTIVECLARLHYPLRGSVPYLASLLRAGDERLAHDVLTYFRTWHLTEAVPHVRTLARLEPTTSRLGRAANDVLRALAGPDA